MQSKTQPAPGEWYSYDRLEASARRLHLNPAEPETEEMLMNLHNNLVWRLYIPRKDEVSDAIFCSAIREVLNDYSLHEEDIPAAYALYFMGAERRN